MPTPSRQPLPRLPPRPGPPADRGGGGPSTRRRPDTPHHTRSTRSQRAGDPRRLSVIARLDDSSRIGGAGGQLNLEVEQLAEAVGHGTTERSRSTSPSGRPPRLPHPSGGALTPTMSRRRHVGREMTVAVGRGQSGATSSSNRRSSWALSATTTVEVDIRMAPTAIGKMMPHGASTPAASGSATML